ncbi:ArsR/SmtB family transcription factor [Arthrobacter sp. MMS24-S77]
MPRYAKPPTPTNQRAEAAMKVFGANEVRSAIIRYLSQNAAGSTSGQVARDLGANYQTVFRHLQDLEVQGIVASDAGEQRQGQRVMYRLDREAKDRALADYDRYLDGK